jgi:hypothetical protein
MRTIELTEEEEKILTTILTFLNNKTFYNFEDFSNINPGDIIVCKVLLYREEIDFNIINNIVKKLY